MKRSEITISAITLLAEVSGIVWLFFASYFLRSITDGIPFIQLRIPYISEDQFYPFIVFGVIFWVLVFANARLYTYRAETSIIELLREVIYRSFLWFFLYIAFIYLTSGFIFSGTVPRLIIIYVWIFSTLYSILLRIILLRVMNVLYHLGKLPRKKILVIRSEKETPYILIEHPSLEYMYASSKSFPAIYALIREKKVDTILSMLGKWDTQEIEEMVKLCEIYGISYAYPKILPHVYELPKHDTFIGWIPVVESISISISGWERVLKRLFDILISILWILILSPIFLIIALLIWFEDPSGPVFFRNKRVWLGGKEFILYKFRYMYWKYSIKDAYGVNENDDFALAYEESLKKEKDQRNGPLYKIADDPRKMKIWSFLERFSLDELPQLINVLLGDMSLIGPRPHQPREVQKYSEHHHQVLSVKPGITGMAQVYGREKNTFEEEVSLDTYYIEHYSPILDFLILARTLYVIVDRAFRKK